MAFFSEIEPGIVRVSGKLATEADGQAWTEEFDQWLSHARPLVLIFDAADRPSQPAGKPMSIWMKSRRDKLGEVVRRAIYIAHDPAERQKLVDSLPVRSKSSPYPMSVVADEPEALKQARASR